MFLCDKFIIFLCAIALLFSQILTMPNKGKSKSKSSSAEVVEEFEDAEFATISKLLQLQERMFKNFVESIAANLTKRVDDLVDRVADLKASIEFSQNDIDNHKTQINLLDTNLQSAIEEISKLLNNWHQAA